MNRMLAIAAVLEGLTGLVLIVKPSLIVAWLLGTKVASFLQHADTF